MGKIEILSSHVYWDQEKLLVETPRVNISWPFKSIHIVLKKGKGWKSMADKSSINSPKTWREGCQIAHEADRWISKRDFVTPCESSTGTRSHRFYSELSKNLQILLEGSLDLMKAALRRFTTFFLSSRLMKRWFLNHVMSSYTGSPRDIKSVQALVVKRNRKPCSNLRPSQPNVQVCLKGYSHEIFDTYTE